MPENGDYGFVMKLAFVPDAPHKISIEVMFGASPVLMWAKQITVVYLETLVEKLKGYAPCSVRVFLRFDLVSETPPTGHVTVCKSCIDIPDPHRFPSLGQEIERLLGDMENEYIEQLKSFSLPGIVH